MSHLIDKSGGTFDPSRRFAFTNITDEPLESAWDGQPIVIPPGRTVELPHHLANKLTDELVDKIIIGNVKREEEEYKSVDPVNRAYFRSPSAGNLGVPSVRKELEDQIVRELAMDEESPEVQVMRAQLKEEVMADVKRSQEGTAPAEAISLGAGEFEDLNVPKGGVKAEKKVKAPLRIKEVK